MITGRSASRSRAIARSSAAPSASGRTSGRGLGQLRLGRLHEHDVEREVEERGSGLVALHRVPGVVDQARDLGRRARGRGQLHQRADDRHVVDLLQRALAPAHRGRAPAERQHGRAVLLRRRERAERVRHARARGQRGHARLARDLRPALGGERRGRLVARVHELDALGAAAVVDREQVPAREGEETAHAVRLQPARDQPARRAVPSTSVSMLIAGGIYPPAGGSRPGGR